MKNEWEPWTITPQDRRRVPLCILAALIAVIAGYWLISPDFARDLIRYGGYWLLLGTFLLFLWTLWHTIRENGWQPDRSLWFPVCVCGLATFLLLLHEPIMFKVLSDETVLLVTSYSMHLERQVHCATQAHELQGAFFLLDGYVDKRPYFFPFLVSLLHDLTGYRPENAFVLNGLLAFTLFLMVWIWGRRTGGTPGALSIVLLLAGLPLLAGNATGGGFDLLNLVMIVASLLLGQHFLRVGTPVSMSAFCLGVVLLAQTRYESALFVVAFGVLAAVVWIRERRVFLSWPVVFAPLLLLPYAWQHRIFRLSENLWQLPDDLNAPFSIAYIAENFGHAIHFLFDFSLVQPNSLLLTLVGGTGLVATAAVLLMRRGFLVEEGNLTYAVFGGVILLNFLILLGYHWGQIDSHEAARLSLPLHLLFALSAVRFVFLPESPRWVCRAFPLVCGIFALGYGVPAVANHFPLQRYMPAHETEWVRSYVRSEDDRNIFYISQFPGDVIIERAPAISHERAAIRTEALWMYWRFGMYDEIHVFQRIIHDPLKGTSWIPDRHNVGPEFILEPVDEKRLNERLSIRVSRIVGFDIEEPDDEELPELRDLWQKFLP